MFLKLLLLVALIAGAPPLSSAEPCPGPEAPARIAQTASLDTSDGPIEIRAIEAPGTSQPPRLVLLGASCHPLLSLALGGVGREDPGPEPFPRLLRFRIDRVDGLPRPLLVATGAVVGGSDTLFETQLIAHEGGEYRALLHTPVRSLIEGGFYVGDLGPRIGPGIADWGLLWSAGESRVGPHRWALHRKRWDGREFRELPTLTTREKHEDATSALRELGVHYPDMTRAIADFEPYR